MAKPPAKSSAEEYLDEIFKREKGIAPEVLLAEIDDLLTSKPAPADLGAMTDDVVSWLGRAKGAIQAWDSIRGTFVVFDMNINAGKYQEAYRELVGLLFSARADLRLRQTNPASVAVEQGKTFDYFDGLRRMIEASSVEVFFVDQYLDAEFAARYLPIVPAGVRIRLLGREKYITKLVPAAEMWVAQAGAEMQIRAAPVHDRFLFVDGKECYQSGSSFKDGGKKAPALIVQITDAFEAVSKTYEDLWATAKVFR
jgi:hypothetical protein